MANPERILGALRSLLTTPIVLLPSEAVMGCGVLQPEPSGRAAWAKGVLRLGLPVCWGHFLFSSWLALGALGGSGPTLLSRAVGLGEGLVGAGLEAVASQGGGPAASYRPALVMSPCIPRRSSELPGTLGLFLVGPSYFPARFFHLMG